MSKLRTAHTAMTTGELMIREGRIEGEIKGKVETTVQFIKGMLKIGMDADTIVATFDLPKTEVDDMIGKIRKGLL